MFQATQTLIICEQENLYEKIISLFLCVTLMFSLTTPIVASAAEVTSTQTFATSDTGYMEITYWTKSSQGRSTDIGSSLTQSTFDFEIKQYESDILLQSVTSNLNNGSLREKNYKNGNLVSSETIYIADRIKYNQTSTDTEIASIATTASSVGTAIGHITYNTTSYGTDERLRVYSKLTNTDNEAFTVNGKVTDTLAVIVGLIAGAFTTWLTNGLIIAQQIAIGIVGGLGGSVAGGAIGITFSEDVAVNAYCYTLTGYNSNTNQYTQGFEGVARLVTSQSSSYYSQWFYDGYTPRNWKANAFAYTLWYQFFAADYYPGVLSYT